MAWVCEALWSWVFVGSGSGHQSVKNIDSTVASRFKQVQAVGPTVDRHALLLCAMEEIIIRVDVVHDQLPC